VGVICLCKVFLFCYLYFLNSSHQLLHFRVACSFIYRTFSVLVLGSWFLVLGLFYHRLIFFISPNFGVLSSSPLDSLEFSLHFLVMWVPLVAIWVVCDSLSVTSVFGVDGWWRFYPLLGVDLPQRVAIWIVCYFLSVSSVVGVDG